MSAGVSLVWSFLPTLSVPVGKGDSMGVSARVFVTMSVKCMYQGRSTCVHQHEGVLALVCAGV